MKYWIIGVVMLMASVVMAAPKEKFYRCPDIKHYDKNSWQKLVLEETNGDFTAASWKLYPMPINLVCRYGRGTFLVSTFLVDHVANTLKGQHWKLNYNGEWHCDFSGRDKPSANMCAFVVAKSKKAKKSA